MDTRNNIREYRKQLVKKEKEIYQDLLRQGLVSSFVFHRLENGLNLILDQGDAMSETLKRDLEESWRLPKNREGLYAWPLIGSLLKKKDIERLTYVFEEVQAYVFAQLGCMELLDSWKQSDDEQSIGTKGLNQLELEIEEQKAFGESFLQNMQHLYPEIYEAISGKKDKPEGRIRALPWLEHVDEKIVQRVIDAFAGRSYKQGDLLIKEGEDASSGLFFLVKGKVKVEIRGITMEVLEQGSVIGEMAVLTGYPRTANVVATEPVEGMWIERPAFRKLMSDSKDLENALWEFASMRFAMNLLGTYAPYNQWEQNKFIQWLAAGEIQVPDKEGQMELKNRIGVLLMGSATPMDSAEHEQLSAPHTLSGNNYTFSSDARVFVRAK